MSNPPELPKLRAALDVARKAFSELPLAEVTAVQRLMSDPGSAPDLAQDISDAVRQVQDYLDHLRGGAARLPQVRVPPKAKAPVRRAPGTGSRRTPSKCFDYALYRGIFVKRKGRPVSQGDLFELLKALEAETKRESLTAKVNRMKGQELLAWQRADDLSVTDHGLAEMNRLQAHLTEADFERIREAFAQAWDMPDASLR